MKYLLLLYDDTAAVAALSDDERRKVVEDHIAFSRTLRDTGAMVVGEALTGPEEVRSLRFTGAGEPSVTDGPFLETKESLGGFYLIECASPEAALEIARSVPRSPGLVAELRPVAEV